MSKLKAMVWNIHGAASTGWSNQYEIKNFVVDKVVDIKADVIIINEFVVSQGWDYFQQQLVAHNYIWFITHTSGNNGILIAVKKQILNNADSIADQVYQTEIVTTTMTTKIKDKPNFLQVKLNIGEKELYVIGTRIRVKLDEVAARELNIEVRPKQKLSDEGKDKIQKTQIQFKNQQLKALKEHLDSISPDAAILCGGDFNAWKNPIQTVMGSRYSVSTPTYRMGKWQDYSTLDVWSAVPYNDKNKQLFDHFISTTNVKVVNPMYDGWSFVISNNTEYKDRRIEDYKSDLVGCPDHDILYADIEIS